MSNQRKPPVNVTYEPVNPINWPDGHVRARLTNSDRDECVEVWIHGTYHYLHATTARALQEKLANILEDYNRIIDETNSKHGLTIPRV